MTTIATLVVKLIADAAGFIQQMDATEKRTQSWSQSVSKNMKDFGSGMVDVGKNATTFVTLPLLAAGGAALTYASNLEETKNKSNVVFGSMSNDVMTWSQNSDTALGLSQQKALDAVSTFGAMGQSAGLSAQDNLKWSQSLVQLGSDWSSFYNLNPVDSLNAIQSAVAGQYEPLRRMGIVINQASLEQKAMQMGLLEEGGTLSDAARYQALYALMVEKSSAAQGDFARTADGVANQTRIVRAQFENAAATLGQQLLPYAAQLLGWISQAISWFQALTPEQQKWIVVILAVVAAIGPLLIVIGSLISAVGAIIGVIGAITTPVLIVIAAIAALIAIGYLLYQAWTSNWGGIQEKTASVIAFIQSIINGGMQFIQDLTSGKLGAVSEIWNRTWQTIQLYFQTVAANFMLILAAFSAAFHGDWYKFGELLRQVWDNTWRMIGIIISTAWANIKTAVSALATNVIDFFRSTDWGSVGKNIVLGIANGLAAGASMIAAAAKNAAQAALDAAKGFLGIHSPSSVFEMQVGWQMAAGAALGWERGLDTMLSPTMPQLDSSAVGGVAGVSAGSNNKSGEISIGPIHVTIQGNANESDVRRGVSLGIGDAMRAAGRA